MCTIIGGKINYDPELIEGISVNDYFGKIIQRLLTEIFTKGGDYVRILIFRENNSIPSEYIYSNDDGYAVLFKQFKQEILPESFDEKLKLSFLIFSRLAPEMESSNALNNFKLQPYKTIDKNYIVAHGTIPLKDFIEENETIDTEILRYQKNLLDSIEIVEDLNGKIAMIKYFPEEDKFETLNNGLGMYEYSDARCLRYYSNINNNDRVFDDKFSILKINDILPYKLFSSNATFGSLPKKLSNGNRLVSLFSGGLDILTSTHVHILDEKPISIDLLYFDWGTNARVNEIQAGCDYLKHLDKITDVDKNYTSLNVRNIFSNLLEVVGLTKTRIADPDAKGMGQDEAEEAISYVPIRNSLLIDLAVAWAEQKYPNEAVDILIGANLSEGMIYADNSTSFIDAKNTEIKYIGQKTSKFNLVAPFANVTKTEMLIQAKRITDKYKFTPFSKNMEVPIELAFSCYFPVDDKPCNECGSCLLRNAAIKRANPDSVIKEAEAEVVSMVMESVKNERVKAVDPIIDFTKLNIGDIIIDDRTPSIDLEVICFNPADNIIVTDYFRNVESTSQQNIKLYKENEIIFLSYKN